MLPRTGREASKLAACVRDVGFRVPQGGSFTTGATNSSGVTSYTTTVPTGKAPGSYTLSFTASKSGYTNSPTTVRTLVVASQVSARIDNLTGTTVTVQRGQSANVRYSFTNTGNTTWTFGAGASLRRPDGQTPPVNLPLQAVSVGAGASTTVSWTNAYDVSGNWSLRTSVWRESTDPPSTRLADAPGAGADGWLSGYVTVIEPQRTLIISSLTPGDQSASPGQTPTYTITVHDGSGAAVSGATVQVNDGVGFQSAFRTTNSSGLATYIATVQSGLAPGPYAIAFYAQLAGYTNSSTVTRTVNVSGNLVANGGFENGASGWVLSGDAHVSTTLPNARTGHGYAYLGADAAGTPKNNVNGTMYQTISIPAGGSSATLTLWYYVTSQEACGTAYDVLDITVQDATGGYLATVAVLSNKNASPACQGPGTYQGPTILDMTPFRGRTVRLSFLGTSDLTNTTVFRIDDVALTWQ